MKVIQRVIGIIVVLVMVLGLFASPVYQSGVVKAQDEVPTETPVDPTLEVPTDTPTDVPTEEPTLEPTVAPTEAPTVEPTEPAEIVPLVEASEDTVVPGQYIVVYKDEMQGMSAMSTTTEVTAAGGEVLFTYDAALNGFAAKLSDEALQKLRQDPNIAYIEEDQTIKISDDEGGMEAQSDQTGIPSWGIDRIDQRNLPMDGHYFYPSSSGVGVHAYVLDTGIRFDHEQFGGRAISGYDFIDNDSDASDCQGHGTHVAGTIGGSTVGVAKSVTLVAVRVLDCGGSGTNSQVIAGINWVAANAIKPAVANMSLGGPASVSLDTAVKNAITKGITFAVAAGNSGFPACYYSPARVSTAITVGATDQYDSETNFTNYGSCLDIYAPGEAITSSTITGTNTYGAMDGTSMAAPHVTGAAALYLAGNPTAKPSSVASALSSNSTKNIIYYPWGQSGSPNKLLYIPNTMSTSAPSLLLPASGAYINDPTPTLTWKPKYNADQFEYQVSTVSNYLTLADSGSTGNTSVTVGPVLAEGKYYWRVRAVNSLGIWSSWSGSKTFTVDLMAPAAPLLKTPLDGTTKSGIPTFSWYSTLTASRYQFGYDTSNAAPPNDYLSGELTSTAFKPTSFPPMQDIYWFVRAKDKAGNWSEWSVPFSFYMTPLIPSAPKLLTPKSSSITNNTTPMLTWAAASYADTYELQVGTDSAFTFIAREYIGIHGLSQTVDLALTPGKYYWRVHARNVNGEFGKWSSAFSFTVDTMPPLPPVLAAPANYAPGLYATPTFSWASSLSANAYQMQIDNNVDFSSPEYTSAVLTGRSIKPAWLMEPGTWMWRVRARDAAGNWSGWSGYRSLVIIPPAIVNGSFEEGFTGWSYYNAGVYGAGGPWPHTGGAFAVLDDYNYDDSIISQDTTMTYGLKYLHFWYYIDSEDYCGYWDYALVAVNGTILKDYDLCYAKRSHGWVHQVISLAAYANQPITLDFYSYTDSSYASFWLLDDILITNSSATPVIPSAVASGVTPEQLRAYGTNGSSQAFDSSTNYKIEQRQAIYRQWILQNRSSGTKTKVD